MRGFLTRIVERRLRRLAVGAGFGVVIGTTGAAGTAAPDPRFGQADFAAERAQILITDACGVDRDTVPVACEKRLRKALELLARVRASMREAASP
jgi:hypothetical protein